MATDTTYREDSRFAGYSVTSGNGSSVVPKVALVDGDGNAASATATATQVAASTSAVTLLAANASRKGATVYYDGAAILYLLEGAGVPSATNFTYKLGSGLYTAYEAPAGFTGALKGIWSAATGSANVTERTA